MSEFECTCCKYVTDNKSNYNRHIKSTKHIKTTQSKPYCEICNKNYVNKGNFLRHITTYHPGKLNQFKKLQNNKNDNTNNECDKDSVKDNTIIDHVNIVKEQLINEINKSNKEVIQVVNNAIKHASSLIKYFMEHHKSTFPLKKLNQTECIKLLRDKYKCPKIKNNYKLEEIFLKEYKDNVFITNISKFILTLVNNNDKKIQPIWNTDCARNHYVIKTSDNWNEDKAGIKFTEYVIRPILNIIKELMDDYTENLNKTDKRKFNQLEITDYFEKLTLSLKFINDLITNKLTNQILSELSPYLRYLVDEIEEMEKYNELDKIQENLNSYINNDKQDNSNSESNSESESEDKSTHSVSIYKLKNGKTLTIKH